VNLDSQSMRVVAREACLELVRAGHGWHAYVLDKAERMGQSNPDLYGDLTTAVEGEIGVSALPTAKRALKWFRDNPAGEMA